MTMDSSMIAQVYAGMRARQDSGRRLLGRPLTLTEKILFAHVASQSALTAPPVRRKSYVDFHPDRDRVFSVGDLIDRGPQSREVVKFLQEHSVSDVSSIVSHHLGS